MGLVSISKIMVKQYKERIEMFRISFHKRLNKFHVVFPVVGITGNRKSLKTIGYFDSYIDAVVCRNQYCNQLHGQGGLAIEWIYRRHKRTNLAVLAKLEELRKKRSFSNGRITDNNRNLNCSGVDK
jgi:hypothetical protein